VDRIDRLLDELLETGEVPADATPDERAELEAMVAAAGFVRTARESIDLESRAALPIARARFERALAASRRPATVARASAASPPSGRPARFPKTLGLALAGVALVFVLAFAANRAIFSRVDTASALEPGDLAQVEGVVTRVEPAADGHRIHVASAIGDVVVHASPSTSIVDEHDVSAIEAVRPGIAIVISGVVGDDRAIAARTLALGSSRGELPLRAAVQRLRAGDAGMNATVVSFSLTPDGTARVVLQSATGRLLLAVVEAESAARLLESGRVLGARVHVESASAGRFALRLLDDPLPTPSSTPGPEVTPPPGRPDALPGGLPSPVHISGLVLAGEPGELTILTIRGRVRVEVPDGTRVVAGATGIDITRALEGRPLVGRLVVVRGGLDAETRAVVADILVVGREAERPTPGR